MSSKHRREYKKIRPGQKAGTTVREFVEQQQGDCSSPGEGFITNNGGSSNGMGNGARTLINPDDGSHQPLLGEPSILGKSSSAWNDNSGGDDPSLYCGQSTPWDYTSDIDNPSLLGDPPGNRSNISGVGGSSFQQHGQATTWDCTPDRNNSYLLGDPPGNGSNISWVDGSPFQQHGQATTWDRISGINRPSVPEDQTSGWNDAPRGSVSSTIDDNAFSDEQMNVQQAFDDNAVRVVDRDQVHKKHNKRGRKHSGKQ